MDITWLWQPHPRAVTSFSTSTRQLYMPHLLLQYSAFEKIINLAGLTESISAAQHFILFKGIAFHNTKLHFYLKNLRKLKLLQLILNTIAIMYRNWLRWTSNDYSWQSHPKVVISFFTSTDNFKHYNYNYITSRRSWEDDLQLSQH